MSFDTAVFTDVTAGESVDGRDGFNFQSASPGIDGTDRDVIRSRMLHQISLEWPSELDATSHPPSAAYCVNGERHYLSRGKSTGTTHNGRRGNQLTCAIVAHDGSDLLPYVPAQIHACRNWRVELADEQYSGPGANGPTWSTPLEVDPRSESEDLLDSVENDDRLSELLPVLLTMTEQACREDATKFIIISEDLDAVLRIIATVTLLISRDDALALEYRGLVGDPYRTPEPVVGVHPKFFRHTSSANILDLTDMTATSITPSPTAVTVTEWVRTLDHFDALETIALARRWMPVLGTELGSRAAEVITGVRDAPLGKNGWDLARDIIDGLAGTTVSGDLETYSEEIADALSAYRLSTGEDFLAAARLARLTDELGVPELTEAVLMPTLECLEEYPQFVADWGAELTSGGRWTWPTSISSDNLVDLFTNIINNRGKLRDRDLPTLLTLVASLSADIDSSVHRSDWIRTVERATLYISDNPDAAAAQCLRWYGAEDAHRILRDTVIRRLRGAEGNTGEERRRRQDFTVNQVLLKKWDFLADRRTRVAPEFPRWLSSRTIDLRKPPRTDPQYGVVALHRCELPKDADQVIGWLSVNGMDSVLFDWLTGRFTGVLSLSKNDRKKSDVRKWIPLAEEMVRYSHGSAALERGSQSLLDDLNELHDAMPETFLRTIGSRLSRHQDSDDEREEKK